MRPKGTHLERMYQENLEPKEAEFLPNVAPFWILKGVSSWQNRHECVFQNF